MSKLRTILFISFFTLISFGGMAQDLSPILVNESFDNISLIDALKTLRKNYKLKFAYDHKLVMPYTVSQKLENLSVYQAMEQLLNTTELKYKIQERTIIIFPSQEHNNLSKSVVVPNKVINTSTIRGIIKDSQTGETLPFANIKIFNGLSGTTTNVDGFFSLIGLPSRPISLEISYLGYLTKYLNVYPDEANQLLEIYMTSKTELLQELVIEDRESETIHSGENISQLSINPSRLLSLPSFGELDIFRTLQFLPGISGTDETSAGLVIRGSTPDQNLILFDGFSVYHIDHFFGVFSAFNSNAIKNIQVYKGAFESKYGGRASSVVDITGKSGNSNKPSYGFGLNLISLNGVLEMPLGNKFSLFLAGRRSHTDILQTGLYREIFNRVIIDNREIINNLKDRDFEDIEPEFNFYDVNAKLTFRPNPKNVLAFSYYSGRDNLVISADQQFSGILVNEASNIGFPADFDWRVGDNSNWGNDGFSTRWGKQWGQKFYSNFNLAYSEYQSQQINTEKYYVSLPNLEIVDTLFIDRKQRIINTLSDLSFRWDNEWKISNKSNLAFGALLTRNRINFQFYFNSEVVDQWTQLGEQISFYLQNTFKPVKDLTLNLGVRSNHYSVVDGQFYEPRASFTYDINKKLSIKGAWGKNNQFINRVSFEENFYDINSAFWLIANGQNIPYINSEHFVTGFSYETNNFLFDVEGYHKDTKGIIDFLPNVADFEDDEQDIKNVYLTGNSIAKGIDFLLQKKTGRHTGWISYSISKVENSFKRLNQGKPFAARQDQRHEFKLVNMFSFGKWDLSTTWVYGSGKPYSDPRNGTPILLLDSLNTYFVASDFINTERLPDYHRLDFSASYNFKLGGANAQMGLSIYNVYGRKNVKYRRFSTLDFNEIANESTALDTNEEQIYIASDVALLGFTPNLFFNYRF